MIDDLHLWLFSLLAGDAALQADLGDPARIFDKPPPRRALPSLYLGRIEASDWSTDDGLGQAFIATLHIYSRGPSRAELYRIASRISELLASESWPGLAGSTRIVLATEMSASFAHLREEAAFHGIIRFRFLCEPSST